MAVFVIVSVFKLKNEELAVFIVFNDSENGKGGIVYFYCI